MKKNKIPKNHFLSGFLLRVVISMGIIVTMNLNKDKYRFLFIDVLRGITIILMFFFHFSFDLNLLGFIKVDIINSPFWYFLPRLIVFLFFFAVGMSLSLAHHDSIKWKLFLKRLLKIGLLAGLISLATFYTYPDNWIYFGTLHSIAVVSVFTLPFLKFPKICLLISVLLFFRSMFFNFNLPWFELPQPSFDYISPFPWVGASLLGVFAVSKNLHKLYLSQNCRVIKSLNFLGQNSLMIYIIHQPIFLGVLYVIKYAYEKQN